MVLTPLSEVDVRNVNKPDTASMDTDIQVDLELERWNDDGGHQYAEPHSNTLERFEDYLNRKGVKLF